MSPTKKQHLYGGDGRQTKKQNNTGEITVFVYDAIGKQIAEYDNNLAPPPPQTSYTATDVLGSPRVITNQAGAVTSRRDFMPFGEELNAGTPNRTASQKYQLYGADNIRKRFTGYEKDAETGLDFAEARYYQNKHGRFTAVDPLLASGKSANPQTFNRYVYVMNQPLRLTDPTGLQAGSTPDDEEPVRVDTHTLGAGWLKQLGFDLYARIGAMFNNGDSPSMVYHKTGVDVRDVRMAQAMSSRAEELYGGVESVDPTGIFKATKASIRADTGQGSGSDAIFAQGEMAFNILGFAGAGTTKTVGKGALSLADDVGKQPFRVALGLTDNGELFTFARQRNATTYFEYLNTRTFDPDAFTKLMNKADEIHFNTNKFDFRQFGRWARDDGQLRVVRGNSTVTNWELQQVMVNSSWRNKLKF